MDQTNKVALQVDAECSRKPGLHGTPVSKLLTIVSEWLCSMWLLCWFYAVANPTYVWYNWLAMY